jgi:hypothetical protein
MSVISKNTPLIVKNKKMNPESTTIAGIIKHFSLPDARCTSAELKYYDRYVRAHLRHKYTEVIKQNEHMAATQYRSAVKLYLVECEQYVTACDLLGFVPGHLCLRFIPGVPEGVPVKPVVPYELSVSSHPHVLAALAFSLVSVFSAGV